MVLDTLLLNTQYYKVMTKGKWNNPDKGVMLFSTPWFGFFGLFGFMAYQPL